MTPSIPWQSEKTLNFPISSWPHCNAVGSTSNAVGTNPSGNAVGISCPSDIPPLTHTVDPYDGAPRMHEYKSLCKDKKDSCRISIKRHHKRCDEQTVHGNVDVSAIHSLFDFLLRRLIIKCVCYFPEFVSFKALREISFERIWVNLNRFGNPFWHPFKQKLGPFWGLQSLQQKKKDSATRPPQNPKFSTSGLFLVLPAPPEGTLLEAFSIHVAIQRRPEVENWRF